MDARAVTPADIIREAGALRRSLEAGFREEVVGSLYGEVERVARRAVRDEGSRSLRFEPRGRALVVGTRIRSEQLPRDIAYRLRYERVG